MNALDWVIIVIYLGEIIGLSVYLGRSQSSEEDYFVGGRNLSWWSVGLTTMDAQPDFVQSLYHTIEDVFEISV